jgi:lipopolysaccharide export system protein LptC
VTTAYPAQPRDTAFPASARDDIDRTYRNALRHSRHVHWLRYGVLSIIAIVLLGVTAANYLPSLGEIRLPGELGKLVIKGTRITMQQPKLNGYTSDQRAYEFTADTAAQDITKPDLVELQQIHAKMDMRDKTTVEMTAPSGTYDMKANTLTLNDDIVLVSSTGYAARLTQALVDMKSGDVASDQPVKVKLLNGDLKAKQMRLTDHGDVIDFTGHVTLVLLPDKSDKAGTP